MDEYSFNASYLNAKKKNNLKKYILVYYIEKDKIKCLKVFSYNELKKIEFDIIVKYYIEELDITGDDFESQYNSSICYKIENIGYIKKVIPNLDLDDHYENEEVKSMIDNYDKNWKRFNLNEENFFYE